MFEDALNAIDKAKTALGGAKKNTGQGSFRNVSFLTLNEQKQIGGRRLIKREYPLRDTGGVNDLGRKLRERTFSACIIGKNEADAQKQADALITALDDEGSGELVHPDFGTVEVMVDSWECRRKADDLNYFEFTITVYPALTDSAPEVSTDTSAAVSMQRTTLFGSLSDTLTKTWQTIPEGTAAASAVAEAITGVINDLYDAVDSLGVMQNVNSLLGALSTLKGSAIGLINKPAMLGASLLGAMSGLSSLCDTSSAFDVWGRLGQRFHSRQASIDVSHCGEAARSNVTTLFYLVDAATLSCRAEAASAALTAAIENQSARDRQARAPVLETPHSALSSSTSNTATASLLNTIIPNINGTPLLSQPESAETHLVFESISDIAKATAALSDALDTVILQASEMGLASDAAMLTQLRLLTVYDLQQRGLALSGVEIRQLATTEPALVALYRFTGNSRRWQRLARRNNINNPLFIQGGVPLEVINE